MDDAPAGRWRALAAIAAAQVGAMSMWFSAAAVAPSLARDWHLSTAQLALLTVAVQIGFVTGGLASAISGLADLVSARRVFIVSALAAAGVNALLLWAQGRLGIALASRFALEARGPLLGGQSDEGANGTPRTRAKPGDTPATNENPNRRIEGLIPVDAPSSQYPVDNRIPPI